jgi:hypothetical protein
MGAVRQKLLFQFSQNRLRRTGIVRERLGEELGQDRRLYIRKDRSFLDVLQILRE